jgi:enhancing lycopene biosynthesis protein 2
MVKHSNYHKRIYYQYEESTVIVGNGSIFFRILKSEFEELRGECFKGCEVVENDIKKLLESVKKDGEPARIQNMLCYTGDILTRIYKSNSGEIIGVKEDFVKICNDLEMEPGTMMTAPGKNNAPLYTDNIVICPIYSNYRAMIEHILGVDK